MLACAACGFGPDPSRWAFLATTGILTFVPLILFLGLAVYFYRKVSSVSEEAVTRPLGDRSESDPARP